MYEYDFNTYSVRKKKSRKRFYFLLGLITFISIFFIFSGNNDQEKKTVKRTDVTESQVLAEQTSFTKNALGGVVASSLRNTQGTYAVAVINNKTRESYFLNEKKKYEAASLYKLWVMATVFQQIEAGNLSEDTVLEVDVAELNKKFHIASESAELTEGTMNFTVASALKQMITISHNYAALALTEKIKLSTVEKFLVTNGFSGSRVGGANALPVTNASDTALFFDKLTKGQLAGPESTEKMIELLKGQRLNNKLPRYLPGETVIAHKTGELGLFTHDAGIVYLPDNSNYIIVVLSESIYPPGAEERISQISQNVFRYFTR